MPDRIVGTSIGAVIGGLYAAGLPAEAIRDIFDDVAGSGSRRQEDGEELRDLLEGWLALQAAPWP